MIRDTSVESYKQVVESGYLTTRLIRAYDIVFRFGPLTSREANKRFVGEYDEDNLNLFRSLLSQLQDIGVIATGEKVKCPQSLKNVYQFDVTGSLPTKPKKVTMADKKRDLLATVERLDKGTWPWCAMEIDTLKSQINNL